MFLTELRPTTWTTNPFINAAAAAAKAKAEVFTPRVSLYEATDAFWIRAEIPAGLRDSVQVSVATQLP